MDWYLIWSHEHGAWWRPDRCGYTIKLAAAGRYDRDEAISICAHARDGWGAENAPSEIPVREDDAIFALSRHDEKTRGLRNQKSRK